MGVIKHVVENLFLGIRLEEDFWGWIGKLMKLLKILVVELCESRIHDLSIICQRFEVSSTHFIKPVGPEQGLL